MSPPLGGPGESHTFGSGHLAPHLLPLPYGPDILHVAVGGQRRWPVAVVFLVLTVGWEIRSLVCRRNIGKQRNQ